MKTDWVWVPFQVEPRFEGYRVDRFLAQRLAAYSRSRIQKILEDARVMRGTRVMKASARVRGGERIVIAYPRRAEEPLPVDVALTVLYEDEALLIIDKPANLLSHPTGRTSLHTVLGVVRHLRPDLASLHLLHRLDRETSGVLALGKTPAAARGWTRLMTDRKIQKTYLALVAGIPGERAGRIVWPIGREAGEIKVRQAINVPGAVSAATRFEVVASGVALSLVRAYPETGRLHQIRVHLAALGHPLLGDVLYNGNGALFLKMTRHQLTLAERMRLGFPRLALHAAELSLPHPLTGKPLRVSAPLPADFAEVLAAQGIAKLIHWKPS